MPMLTEDVLKEAFKKLLSYSYYDKTNMILRRRVATFAASLKRVRDEEQIFDRLMMVGLGLDNATLNNWLSQMKMAYYPKQLKEDEDNNDHLVTNIPSKEAVVERLLIKCDIPAELLILDVAWVLMYGFKSDSDLSKNSWGNRLDLIANSSAVRKGDSLFRKYQTQYSGWWRSGLNKANEQLKNKQNVSIVSFDITNYYHSVDFDFDDFTTDYESIHPDDGMRDDALTEVIRKIYEQYWTLTRNCDEEAFLGNNAGKRPLPLSLMSAHIFANWYLKPLDEYIEQHYHPLYYGRYVDDCMVVVKTTSDSKDWKASIDEELPGLLDFRGETARFQVEGENQSEAYLERLASLQIQQKKVYLYRFDCELPPSSLQQFEESQKERSSEYRFMTDDYDAGAANLSTATLIETLDPIEESGRRFNILEENKYRLAVYLAKLSQRLAKFGKEYKHYDEVEKLYGYFKGSLLIKHYVLWERIMTIFVLADKKDYVRKFENAVRQQIAALKVADGLFVLQTDGGLAQLQDTLLFHLEDSVLMAMSLHAESDVANRLYLDTFMVRMHYNNYPMQEFCKGFEKFGVRLPMGQLDIKKSLLQYRWMPYYVKYYDIVAMMSIGETYDKEVFKKAFALYLKLNHLPDYIGASAFWHVAKKNKRISEFNTHLAVEDPDFHRDEGLTVAVVNMDRDEHEDQVHTFGTFNIEKALTSQIILDRITEIEAADLFLLPEMTLPLYELREYMHYSASREVAFVAGMEYVVKNRMVYNYIITCLPITLFGRMDAVPVIRLKNHYAPAEIATINKNKAVSRVPKNSEIFQNLFHWRDHVFTCYYCFELTSIKERSEFYSLIDAMYCPVFNPDTYYFNNIAESMARDMHCYFVLANVSHFGDSRVTAPMKHDRMNLLKVKGGNTEDNSVVVLTAKLDIDRLRDFQLLDAKEQKKDETFKQTPPDYKKENVAVRKGKFVFEQDAADEIISDINRMIMEFTPHRSR